MKNELQMVNDPKRTDFFVRLLIRNEVDVLKLSNRNSCELKSFKRKQMLFRWLENFQSKY